LLKHISEFLVFDQYLTRGFGTITGAESNIISDEVTGKGAWSKENSGCLSGIFDWFWEGGVETVLFGGAT
jgi:hypothetical protein